MRFVHAHLPTVPHLEFDAFYSRYASSLWGLISLAQLSISQSETIFINTLRKAWQQHQQERLPNTQLFAKILQLAYQEGLPTSLSVHAAIRLVRASPDSHF